MFDRLRRRTKKSTNTSGSMDRSATRDDRKHLEQFVKTRRSVEAYVEPRTNVTEMTVVLVAADGEWTRRRVKDEKEARKLTELGIPVYDVQRTGYPPRMREWTKKHGGGAAS